MQSDYQLRRSKLVDAWKGRDRFPVQMERPIEHLGRKAYVPKIQIPAGQYTDRARLGQYFGQVDRHGRGLGAALKTSKLALSKKRVVVTDAVPSPLGSPELTSWPWIELEQSPVSLPHQATNTEQRETCSVVPEPRFRLVDGKCVRL